jgi:hypothetical protein
MSSVIKLNPSEDIVITKHAYLTKLVFNNGNEIFYGKPLTIDIYFYMNKPVQNLIAAIAVTNIDGARIATFDSEITSHHPEYLNASKPGEGKITFLIDNIFFQPTYYKIDVGLRDSLLNTYDILYSCGTIEVKADNDTPLVLCELSEPGSIRQPIKTKSAFFNKNFIL